MANSAEQVKRKTGGSHEKFLRIPYALLQMEITVNGKKRKLNASQIKVISSIHTFSTKEQGSDCAYKKLSKRYRFSPCSAGRAVRSARDKKLIERGEGSKEYRLTEKVQRVLEESIVQEEGNDNKLPPFLKIDDWIYEAQFDGRFLTGTEIFVLFYLWSRTENGKITFYSTSRYIARGLNLSHTIVNKAIQSLKQIGLIYYREQAKNNHVRTDFTVNDNFMRNKRKAILNEKKKKNEEKKPATVQALDERSDFDRYYAEKRNNAQLRADSFNKQARADEQYRLADDEKRAVEPKLSMAEHYNLPGVEALKKRLTRANMIRAERLTALGLSEEDLLPRYTCPICEDSGFRLDNGHRCDCYPYGDGGGGRP